MLKVILDLAVAIFSFLAAVFWFLSVLGDIPALTTHWGALPVTDPFFVAMQRSAQMNMFAASFAGLAAFTATVSAVVGAMRTARGRGSVSG